MTSSAVELVGDYRQKRALAHDPVVAGTTRKRVYSYMSTKTVDGDFRGDQFQSDAEHRLWSTRSRTKIGSRFASLVRPSSDICDPEMYSMIDDVGDGVVDECSGRWR